MGGCLNAGQSQERGDAHVPRVQIKQQKSLETVPETRTDVSPHRQVTNIHITAERAQTAMRTTQSEANSLTESHINKFKFVHLVQQSSNIERQSRIDRLAQARETPSDFFAQNVNVESSVGNRETQVRV